MVNKKSKPGKPFYLGLLFTIPLAIALVKTGEVKLITVIFAILLSLHLSRFQDI